LEEKYVHVLNFWTGLNLFRMGSSLPGKEGRVSNMAKLEEL
jgi:hypothetical protein